MNICGESDWSQVFSFTTANIACGNFISLDVPLTIVAQGTPTITSTLEVNFPGSIEDVNVVGLSGTHTWVEDLTFELTSPAGTTIVLVDQICGDLDDFDINFDDDADEAPPCPYNDGQCRPGWRHTRKLGLGFLCHPASSGLYFGFIRRGLLRRRFQL